MRPAPAVPAVRDPAVSGARVPAVPRRRPGTGRPSSLPSGARALAAVRVLAVLAVFALGACSAQALPVAESSAISCAAGTLAGQGSSAQATALNTWIKAYQVACPDATIGYDSVGSGAGVKAFLAGTGDFAGTDSPLSAADRAGATERCAGVPAVHLPVLAAPIALAYNVAGVDDLRLRPATIAQIFAGRITRWNDAAIVSENQDKVLPATPIRTVHRSDSSGTTDNFTRFLEATGGTSWTHGAGGTWKAPGGLAVKGSNRVSTTVARTNGAIGYVEASYAEFHRLATALIGNSAGGFAAMTDDAAARTVASAKISAPGAGGGVVLELDHSVRDEQAYPLVLISYEIVCSASQRSALLKSFLGYAVGEEGQREAARLGYAPLPDALRDQVRAALE